MEKSNGSSGSEESLALIEECYTEEQHQHQQRRRQQQQQVLLDVQLQSSSPYNLHVLHLVALYTIVCILLFLVYRQHTNPYDPGLGIYCTSRPYTYASEKSLANQTF